MTHAGPLPGIRPLPLRPGGLAGAFRGFVEQVNPLAVSLSAVSGPGQMIPHCYSVPGLALTQGDAVWVLCVDGDRDELLVFAKAAASSGSELHVSVTVNADRT